jgi:hypothetical protein
MPNVTSTLHAFVWESGFALGIFQQKLPLTTIPLECKVVRDRGKESARTRSL